MPGCRIKTEHLPVLSHPYISEVKFLAKVENRNGKAWKKEFKDNIIISPCYFFLKIKELENSGTITVRFFNHKGLKMAERQFHFGEQGTFYDYVIFFDKITHLKPGLYYYAVIYNKSLIYEDHFRIHQKPVRYK